MDRGCGDFASTGWMGGNGPKWKNPNVFFMKDENFLSLHNLSLSLLRTHLHFPSHGLLIKVVYGESRYLHGFLSPNDGPLKGRKDLRSERVSNFKKGREETMGEASLTARSSEADTPDRTSACYNVICSSF